MNRDAIEDIYPLSPMQQGMLFHSLYDPRSGMYIEHLSCRLRGPLNVQAFEQAWQKLIDRHAVLRTAFVWEDLEQPVQIVQARVAVPLELADWRDFSAEEQQAKRSALLRADRSRGYELTEAPMLRLWLIRCGENEHFFIWSYHHVLMDGWCNGLILQELLASYETALSGRKLSLPPPRPFRDYIAFLASQDKSRSEQFWRDYLRGFTLPTPLVIDHLPDGPLENFSRQTIQLPIETTETLRQLARQCHLTLSTMVHGAYALLLSRYSGERDIVIGTVVSGRPTELEGVDSMIGLFLNTLPLRISISPDKPLIDWLQVLQADFQHLRIYENSPLFEVQGWSEITRGSPLFVTNVVFENYPFDGTITGQAHGLEVCELHTAEQGSYPLSLLAMPGETLALEARYYRSRISDDSIMRLLRHLSRLLTEFAAAPRQSLNGFSLLDEAESRLIVQTWNDTRNENPHDKCLQELFEAQATQTPDAPAVTFETSELTYREFNERANQLAHYLSDQGVGPETPVGVMMSRSLEMVISLYAVLKAGGAYVPLEPDYPASRLKYMLEDAGVPLILTQQHLQTLLPQSTARIVCVDAIAGELQSQPRSNPALQTSPLNLAYIIFTSGSTGRPKGAMNTHVAICNRLLWMQDKYGLAPRDRVLQKTPFSFDVSVWEFFWPLISGARLVVARPGGHQDAAYLVDVIKHRGITTLHFVPSMLNIFIQQTGLEDCQSLRRVICSGEALPYDLQQRFFLRLPHVELHNLYGPTEAAVDVTSWACRNNDVLKIVPIGRPINNIRMHILDDNARPAPIGVPGELYIGGIGLARGYYARPDLTAQRFVPDPLNLEAGARLYRTGDLARYLPDGNIEFLGRLDFQVKIRGNRIEPGEIESILGEHPAVRQAVVTVDYPVASEARLVAYLACGENPPPTVTEMHQFVRDRLPESMIPAAFVALAELPLSPNGKIDRKKLPEVSRERPRVESEYVAPQTALELYLAELWQETLGLEKVGIHDRFLELGGDSIKGVTLINKLQAKLGKVIHVVVLFDAPTIDEQSVFLQREYPEAVTSLFGEESLTDHAARIGSSSYALVDRVDQLAVQQMRIVFQNTRAAIPDSNCTKKNPQAAFLLCPPRSGSTLLRVILAGNQQLFAPPELELLAFDTLSQRAAMFTGRESFWQEGLLRAVMEIKKLPADEAKEYVSELESQDITVREMYRLMQEWIGDRLLVDKTPSNAMDLGILRQAEYIFEDSLYIHLQRHPCGMIRSFEDARLDQIYSGAQGFSRRALAELLWNVCHENILEFFESIPARRRHIVRFEDLVSDPERIVRGLCEFLGVSFVPTMLDPYADKESRMTDGVYPQSRMQGDVKFHQHRGINPSMADRWRDDVEAEERLGNVTWSLGEPMGYERPDHLRTTASKSSSYSTSPLTRMLRPERIPLSFAQQRLWFLDQLSPGNPFYNIPFAVRLQGFVDIEILRRACNEVVRRHESLRTRFFIDGGQPYQEIVSQMTIDVPVTNLTSIPRDQRDDAIRTLVKEHARMVVKLDVGPMIRISVLKLDAEDHVVMCNLHHIAADGWSLDVFIREVVVLYLAFVQNRSSPLAELPVQYSDYSIWQRNWLQGEVLQHQLDYWRSRLTGIAPLELVTDRPRPAVQSRRGHTNRYLLLSASELKALKELSRAEDTTLYMTVLAVFQTLLHRYTNRNDIAVGSPTANRTRSELEMLIGFFVNMLVMRTDFNGNPTFRVVLARVREVVLGAFSHQDLPFEEIVAHLQPDRDLSREPLFQVAFAFQNIHRMAMKLVNLTLSPVESTSETSKFDLTVFTWETEQGLAGALNYNEDLFDSATIDHMAQHFTNLLRSVTANPDQRVSEMSLTATNSPDHLPTPGDYEEIVI